MTSDENRTEKNDRTSSFQRIEEDIVSTMMDYLNFC